MCAKEMHGKRSHFSTHRAKLYGADGKRLCEIRLSHTRDNGVLHIGDVEYRAHGEPADRTWCLLLKHTEVLSAYAPRERVPCVVVEAKAEDGGVCARYRIRRASAPLYEVHCYPAGAPHPGPARAPAAAWAERQSVATSEYTSATCITHTGAPSSCADAADLASPTADHSDEFCPAVQVLASRDFPTPKTLPRPGEPLLCALFDAHHPRKYRVQLCADIDDVPLCFLFFFYMVLRRKFPDATDTKSVGVALADEIW